MKSIPIPSSIPSSNNVTPSPCKCGTIPKVGMTFYYKSKYFDNFVVGVILRIDGINIMSTTGSVYRNSEIEIKPVSIKRDELLTDLGI